MIVRSLKLLRCASLMTQYNAVKLNVCLFSSFTTTARDASVQKPNDNNNNNNTNKTYLLEYEYVENMLEKRGPIRSKHLQYTKPFVDQKRLVAGGALVPKIDRGLIVFRVPDVLIVENFAKNDPYVTEGLVVKWKVTEWLIVVGDDLFLKS